MANLGEGRRWMMSWISGVEVVERVEPALICDVWRGMLKHAGDRNCSNCRVVSEGDFANGAQRYQQQWQQQRWHWSDSLAFQSATASTNVLIYSLFYFLRINDACYCSSCFSFLFCVPFNVFPFLYFCVSINWFIFKPHFLHNFRLNPVSWQPI